MSPRSLLKMALLTFPLLGACSGNIMSDAKDGEPAWTPGSSAGSGALGPGQSGTGAPGTFAGNGVGASGSGAIPGGGDDCATPDTGASVLRRLSRDEYRLTLQQLFQLTEPPAAEGVPEDAQQGGFRTVSAIQGISDQHLSAYLEVAEQLGAELMQDSARRMKVIGCDVAAADCLGGFVERFGRLAFRRALTAEEATSLTSAAQAAAIDSNDAYRFAIEALLTAPSFLFRVEGGEAAPVGELAPSELAARLSFMLWGRGPTAELLDRAEAGELSTSQGIAKVAGEMLAAEQAHTSFRSFFKQWLHFEQLREPNVAPDGFSPALLPDMIGETERLIDDFAWQANTRFTDVLTASYSYLTPDLAEFYGLSASGTGFSRVDFPAGHARAGTGVLTHASVISSKTDADLISHRGAFLRDALMCQKLIIPSSLQEEIQDSVAGLSYLEVVALRNEQQPCAGCHAQIDPVGVAFSQYDAIGYFDASIDVATFGLPTSFSGLAEPSFATLAELSGKLAAEPAVAECIVQKLFIYTQGREPGPADQCALRAASERFAQSNGQFPSIIAAFVESPAFRLRRVE